MSQEDKAIELVAQAEKKVKSSQGFFGGMFGWVPVSLWKRPYFSTIITDHCADREILCQFRMQKDFFSRFQGNVKVGGSGRAVHQRRKHVQNGTKMEW